MTGVLDGLRIVEGSAFIAGPLGGMMLAQLGADVIRFDQIGGGIDTGRWPVTADGKSLLWHGMNKGKRSLAVDFRRPEGREIVTALLAASGPDGGIFVTNFEAKGWLSYDALRRARDDLIMVHVRGNPDGTTALDYTVNAAAGIPFATADATPERPVNHMLPAWDLLCGTTVALGLLVAERHRRRHSAGQLVSLSLADIAFSHVGNLGLLAAAEIGGYDRPPTGNTVYGAFGRDFATADGRRVYVLAVTARQWRTLCAATGIGPQMAEIERTRGLDLTHDGDRYAAEEAISAALAPWFAARDLAAVRRELDAAGACWGPYQTFSEMLGNDPRVSTANPMFAAVDQPGLGRHLMPGSPLDFTAVPRPPVRPAPLLGQHTDEILADLLGLSEREIARLHDAGIVAGPPATTED